MGSYLTSKAGVKLYLRDEVPVENVGFNLNPLGGHKVLKRIRSVLQSGTKVLWDVPTMRETFWYLNNIKRDHGAGALRGVRLLSSYLVSGYEGDWQENDWVSLLRSVGISIDISSREIHIKDSVGKYSFTDDYYWTGMRTHVVPVLKEMGFSPVLVDQRERSSVALVCRKQGLEDLVQLMKAGKYFSTPQTRFYGGKNLECARPPVLAKFMCDVQRSYTVTRVPCSRRIKCSLRILVSEGVRKFINHYLDYGVGPDLDRYKTRISRDQYVSMTKIYKAKGATTRDGVVIALEQMFQDFSRILMLSMMARGVDTLIRYRDDIISVSTKFRKKRVL